MKRPVNRGQLALEASLPAPVGGWNARDALAAMPATDAVTLTNLFPRPDRIVSRGGSAIWSTGMTGNVDTLMEWAGPSSRKMLAFANGSLFDCTTSGAVGAAIVAGLSTAPWQHKMMTTPGGAFLVFCNGTDATRNYDGTSITTPTITVTGYTSADFIAVDLYRFRLFFAIKNSLKVAFLPINSIAGTASILDYGSLCPAGGYMMAIGTWTADGGDEGSDDYIVFVTSQGEILVYAGTDPSTAGAFQLVGRYRVGKPLGRRCLKSYGADLLVLTEDGIYPISSLLKQGIVDPALALSDKIRAAFGDAANTYGNPTSPVFGWQAEYFPGIQRLIVNVPQNSTGTVYAQYVMNSISRAWCPYSGWNSRAWVSFNSNPYFGDTAGRVWRAETGSLDNGVPITVNARQAFTDMGVPGRVKHLLMARPRLQLSTSKSNVVLDADVDYVFNNVATPPPANPALSYWNVALWNQGYWSIGNLTLSDWQTIGAVGTTVALRFTAALNGALQWYGTDVVAEAGGIL